MIQIDGKEVVMTFLTNNSEWPPATIADLYRSRWQIEVFFKQVGQILQLCDFTGHRANAVRWHGLDRSVTLGACCAVLGPPSWLGAQLDPVVPPCCARSLGTDSICRTCSTSMGLARIFHE